MNIKNERAVYILGSSRSDGDTRKILDYLSINKPFDIIDLLDYNFSYFDYQHKNLDDDYLPLMDRILNDYDHLIFATPVYWYSMSALMKCFFDRITDLLKVEKELGRKLRSKDMSVISCSGGDDLDDSFVFPFKASADYLGMHFNQHIHSYLIEGKIPEEVRLKLDQIQF